MAGAYSSAFSTAFDVGAGGGFLAAWAIGASQTINPLGDGMKKNVASQKVGAQLITAADGTPFTGSVTVAVTVDAGTQATGSVGSGACTHEGGGYHTYAPAQAETNGDLVAFTFSGTGAISTTVQLYTLPTTGVLAPTVVDRTLDVSSGGEAGIDWANVGSPTTSVSLSGTTIATSQVVASVSGAVGSVTGAVGSVTGAVGSVTGAVGSVTAGVTLADDAITAAKFDESTAFPLKSNDAGSTAVARVGADSDTLETLSDQLDGIAGNGKVVRAAHLGDLAEDVTLTFLFNTLGANNAPITLAGTPAVSVYKGNSTTQLAEAAALTVDLDSLTGTHAVTLDLSSDAFYATGENYTVVITTGTVDGDSVVGTVVGSFSIENRFDEVDVVALGGAAQSLLDLKDFADDGYNPATNKIAGVVLADTLTTYTGNTPQTGDGYAIVNSGTHGNAALKTLIDAAKAVVDAIKTSTDNLPSDPADASAVAAATDALQAVVDDIQTQVGVAGAGLTAVPKTGFKLASDGLNLVVPADPSAIPALGTANIVTLIGYFGAWSLNEVDATSSTVKLRNSADSADLATHAVSDDATTFVSEGAA